MLMAVECRFGSSRTPETIEMLSDNGSPYTARETRIFARQLGLKPCFTPVRSPQSSGMAAAFVDTFKRDYVQVNPLPDAETVLKLIGGWIEDYNENHPHSGPVTALFRSFDLVFSHKGETSWHKGQPLNSAQRLCGWPLRAV